MKALLTNYHQSPRKVRLVADLIRGKTVPQARVALSFLMQKSSEAFSKLLESAVANSRNSGISPEGLFVKHVSVDKGAVARMIPKLLSLPGKKRLDDELDAIAIGITALSSASKPEIGIHTWRKMHLHE